MDYLAALFPPTVMAIAFTCLIVTIVRSQGGANKYKEDGAAEAMAAAERAARAAAADARAARSEPDVVPEPRPERAG